MIKGFDPIFDTESQVLILGSFPSVKSREVGFYYGHPQNRFWKTLGEAINEPVPDGVLEKRNYLLRHRIALWDVIEQADIVGSSDADLTKDKSKVGDVITLVKHLKNLKLIICNGKKSYAETVKILGESEKIICLPSTSPRNVSFTKTSWLDALKFLAKNSE